MAGLDPAIYEGPGPRRGRLESERDTPVMRRRVDSRVKPGYDGIVSKMTMMDDHIDIA
jgi:hypothetical protein